MNFIKRFFNKEPIENKAPYDDWPELTPEEIKIGAERNERENKAAEETALKDIEYLKDRKPFAEMTLEEKKELYKKFNEKYKKPKVEKTIPNDIANNTERVINKKVYYIRRLAILGLYINYAQMTSEDSPISEKIYNRPLAVQIAEECISEIDWLKKQISENEKLNPEEVEIKFVQPKKSTIESWGCHLDNSTNGVTPSYVFDLDSPVILKYISKENLKAFSKNKVDSTLVQFYVKTLGKFKIFRRINCNRFLEMIYTVLGMIRAVNCVGFIKIHFKENYDLDTKICNSYSLVGALAQLDDYLTLMRKNGDLIGSFKGYIGVVQLADINPDGIPTYILWCGVVLAPEYMGKNHERYTKMGILKTEI